MNLMINVTQACLSNCLAICNGVAFSVARKWQHPSVSYFSDAQLQHGRRTVEALFKLGISEYYFNKLHYYLGRAPVHDLSKAEVLVPTKNRPADLYYISSGLEEVARSAEEISKIIAPPSFISIDLSILEKCKDLDSGVCLGSVQLFIFEYLKNRESGLDFRTAATMAAALLKGGAPKEACALQMLHQSSIVNLEKIREEYSTDPGLRGWLEFVAKGFAGYSFLHTIDPNLRLINEPCVEKIDLEHLDDGVYEITTGWRMGKKNQATGSVALLAHSLHAISLVVDSGEFLIFDPNYGLLQYADPDVYFKIAQRSESGVFLLSKITLSPHLENTGIDAESVNTKISADKEE